MEDEREASGMRKLAIITARGGSKRIPGKNIRDFCGKPIIAYSIEAAIRSRIFDEVMVSTDDERIRQVSMEYGASVPFMRSERTSGDFATTVDVIAEVLDCYESLGQTFDQICCIYPTAPFVTEEKLRKAMGMLSEADAVLPVVRFSFPPLRSVVIKDGFVVPMWEEYMPRRSQDLPAMYHDCGQFYCYRTDRFRASRGAIVMERTAPFFMDEAEVQDIDNEEDWEMAEVKYRHMISKLGK